MVGRSESGSAATATAVAIAMAMVRWVASVHRRRLSRNSSSAPLDSTALYTSGRLPRRLQGSRASSLKGKEKRREKKCTKKPQRKKNPRGYRTLSFELFPCTKFSGYAVHHVTSDRYSDTGRAGSLWSDHCARRIGIELLFSERATNDNLVFSPLTIEFHCLFHLISRRYILCTYTTLHDRDSPGASLRPRRLSSCIVPYIPIGMQRSMPILCVLHYTVRSSVRITRTEGRHGVYPTINAGMELGVIERRSTRSSLPAERANVTTTLCPRRALWSVRTTLDRLKRTNISKIYVYIYINTFAAAPRLSATLIVCAELATVVAQTYLSF